MNTLDTKYTLDTKHTLEGGTIQLRTHCLQQAG